MTEEARKLFITVPGRPIPWARPRRRANVHFNPIEQDTHRKTLRQYLEDAKRRTGIQKPFDGPVIVSATFVFGKEPFTHVVIEEVPGETTLKISRGDLDNYIKLIDEALQDADIVYDDSQVCKLVASKHWAMAKMAKADIKQWQQRKIRQ